MVSLKNYNMKILWETAVVFCLCSLSLVSSHSRRFTTPSVTRITDQFSKIAIENGLSKRFGAHNILVNGSLAKLTLDKSSGNISNSTKFCSVFVSSVFPYNICFDKFLITFMKTYLLFGVTVQVK